MNANDKFEPSSDFVSKTMKRINDLETKRHPFLNGFGMYRFQRIALVVGWTLFGIFNATRVF